MARASDLLFGKVVVKNQLASDGAVQECMSALEDLARRGGASRTLADVMVERGIIPKEHAQKAWNAAKKLQAERYLKFAGELGFVPPDLGARALEAVKARGYAGTVADVLLGWGAIAPERHAQVVARDPRTLDEGGPAAPARPPTPPPAPAQYSQAPAPQAPPGGRAHPTSPPAAPGGPPMFAQPPAREAPPGERGFQQQQPAARPITPAPAPPPPQPAPRPVPQPPAAPPPPPSPPAGRGPPGAPPPHHPSFVPSAHAPAPALALRGTARDFAAIALRDQVISREEIEAALSVAPAQAWEDSRALAAALVQARVLARVHADQIEACSVVERDAPSFEVPGYYLVEPLGFTAEGPVIRARRTTQDGQTLDVALEILTPTLAANPQLFEDFRKRTGALSAPEHPSLARTVDTGRADDSYYLARELPPGETLSTRIHNQGPLPEKEAVRLAFDIAGALAAYHTVGLTHGSVRPENIVLSADGRAILRDVGSTPAPEVLDPDLPPPCADVPRYLSPEQISGDTGKGAGVDRRTDIYALGIVLFEAVTGAPPFDGPTSGAVIAQHFGTEMPDPSAAGSGVRVSPRFAGLLKVMTAKDPGQRYSSADELLDDLQGLREGTMAIDLGEGESPGGSDRTQIYGAKPAGHDRTMISSQDDDLDLKEMRKAAAERRAKEAAAKVGLGLPGTDQPQTPVGPGDDPLLGRVLSGRYRLLKKLGAGGMGAVYKAEHLLLHKTIALKILHPKLLENEESVRRFDREVKAASRFSHPGITQIFDAGEDAGPTGKLHYMVMEYVEGTDLAKIISQVSALDLPRALAFARQVLVAVDEAHKKGIVHRDMKSDNIMVCKGPDGAELAKIMDFGIAKIVEGQDVASATALHNQQSFKTRKGVVTGTPQYMSPEQAAGDPNIDGRSDLYSFGIILYEMCLGELPFKSNTAMGYLGKHIVEPPIPFKTARPDIDLPKDLERIILKALEKTREARYQTAGDMLADLEKTVFPAILAGAGTKSGAHKGGPAGASPGGGGGGKKAATVVLLSIALLGALGGGGYFGWQWWQSHRAAGFTQSLKDATDALAKGDVKEAKRILDDLNADEKPAVKALRERQKALEAEHEKKEKQAELLKKGDDAAAKGDFTVARGLYRDAKQLLDNDLVKRKLDSLAEKERQVAAEKFEDEGNEEFKRNSFQAALGKFEEAFKLAPTDDLDLKIMDAKYRLAFQKAQALVGVSQKEKEVVANYRAALHALKARDRFNDERKATQKKLFDFVETFRDGYSQAQKKTYMKDLLEEAHRLDREKEFRSALVCYQLAARFAERDEDIQARAEDEAAAKRRADEHAEFAQAMERARKLESEPIGTTPKSDEEGIVESLKEYLKKYDGKDEAGNPKGNFVEAAREELKKWNTRLAKRAK